MSNGLLDVIEGHLQSQVLEKIRKQSIPKGEAKQEFLLIQVQLFLSHYSDQ